jgi:hypothetical protein
METCRETRIPQRSGWCHLQGPDTNNFMTSSLTFYSRLVMYYLLKTQ